MEKYGGNLPKAKAVKVAKAKPVTGGGPHGNGSSAAPRVIKVKAHTRTIQPKPAKLQASVDRALKHPPKVDAGNVLANTKAPSIAESLRVVAVNARNTPSVRLQPVRRSFGASLKRELEGKGVLASAAKSAADEIGKNAVIVSTGAGPTIATRAGTSLGGGRSHAATITAPSAVKAPKIVGRALKDAINFPAQAVPSVYVPVASAVEAARGHPARGKQLLRDLPQTDPAAALLTGHPGRALKIANEHPGFAALEAAGVKGTVARGAGRAMRLAPKGSKIHQAASTVRSDAISPDTGLAHKQTYSPDVTRKAVQVATDRRKTKKAVALREQAAAKQDPALLAAANKIDPAIMSDHQIRQRVDARNAVNETIRRHNRTVAVDEAHRAITNTQRPVGGPVAHVKVSAANRRTKTTPTAATTLRAQAISTGTPRDLHAYRDEIAAQHDALGPSAQLANRTLRKQIDKAIAKKPDPAALKQAAEHYAQVMQPRQVALVKHGLLGEAQIAKAPLVPYATRHMGATHGLTEGGAKPELLDAHGNPLSTQQIRAHMARHGIKPPAYVTQKPGQRGARNFFVSSGRPPQLVTSTRTGGATAKGTFDAHPDVLIEGAAKAQGLVDAAEGYKATIHEFAHKPTLGKLKTKAQADQAASDLYAKTGLHYRPVRIHPFGGKEAQIRALLDAPHGGDLEANLGAAQPVREAMDAAIRGTDGPGPWALLPEAAAAQQAAHLHSLGVGPKAKALQVLGSGFRRTVLATSPTWMTGNVVEAGGRAAIARAGPRSYVTARRAVKRLEQVDPAAARELTARATGGGHYSMADRQHIRRDSSQFAGSTVLEPMAKALGAVWRAPVARHLAQAWHGWTDLVFRQLNGRLESQFQTAMLGKALRDSPLMDGHTFKLSKQAIDQAAQGLRDTNEQAQFARQVERMYGKYNGFSPDTKWAIATYTPFIAWTLNATKFVYDVLPRDHPTVTALIAASENATAQWRQDHGLDLFMKGALPGFLQGSIPTAGGGHQRAPGRYTPFGAFGDPLGTLGGAVLPQFSGVLAAFKGEDWKGKKLTKADGSPADTGDKAKAAAASFVDATVPIVGLAGRLATKGPGALNPVKAIPPKAVKGGSGAFDTSGIDLSTLDTSGLDTHGIDLTTLP